MSYGIWRALALPSLKINATVSSVLSGWPADAELRVVVIDQLAKFTGVRAVETFFEPLPLHLQPADRLEQLCLLGLALVFVLGLLSAGEQFTDAIQGLPLPLAHLDRVNGMVGGDLLDRLAATNRLHVDSGLELRAVGAALARRWEPLSGPVPRLRGKRWGLSRKSSARYLCRRPRALGQICFRPASASFWKQNNKVRLIGCHNKCLNKLQQSRYDNKKSKSDHAIAIR